MSRSLASLFICLLIFFKQSIYAQELNQEARNIGLFISSKEFSYSEDFYKEISQFLTIGEDRSWAGKMKSEFIIRIGWMMQEQLQKITQADSTYFMNAEPKLGRAFLDAYNFEEGSFYVQKEELQGLEKIYVITSFEISKRKHRSVYIRSNRMYTEYIPIMVLSLNIHSLDLKNPSLNTVTQVCFDAQTSQTDARFFDLYAEKSAVGKLLSNSFSQWWAQLKQGLSSNCVE